MVKRIFLTTTGANTWTVPGDWNSANNTIECIGGGASGLRVGFIPIVALGGGGGGAYARISNLALTAGSSIDYTVGEGGTSTDGGDTWFNSSSFAGSSVGAKGGKVCTLISTVFTPGLGGSASESIGDVKYSGGNGGSNNGSGGGGGGAAGPNGAGKDGGYNSGNDDNIGGGGGGGANGGSSTNGSNGSAFSGGNGGQGPSGTGAGTGSSTNGNNGSNGAGGGGGRNTGTGGNGGNGNEWDEAGAGGGGGGTSTGTAGNGGLYGGGGGSTANPFGIGTHGVGAQGIIVITYEPIAGFTHAFILG